MIRPPLRAARERLLACLTALTLSASPLTAVDRTADARRFVELLAAEELAAAEAMLDATMQGLMPAAKLREVWSTVRAQAGELEAQESTRTETTGRYRIVYVTCRFERTSLDVKVVFDEEGAVAGLFFVPSRPAVAWQPPDDCAVDTLEESELEIGDAEWRLPATLTLPAGGGPFPAVVLVHGSGPHDRDETIGPNKPFADLACGLATRGVAAFRYVKRTRQHAARLAAASEPFTVQDETVDDALAAVHAVRAVEEVDPRRVFVLGHSLGGMLAPRIGSRDSDLAGLVVLAGAARPLEDVLVEQLGYIRSLSADPSRATDEAIDALLADVAKIQALDATTSDPNEMLAGGPASYWLDLRGYAPADAARELDLPMLVLQGERDYQVTMEDFALWQRALADRPDVTFVSFADLNHLFMKGEGKAVPAEYEVPGHVAREVIEAVAGWVRSQTGTSAGNGSEVATSERMRSTLPETP
jgi:uncharacterized protein